MLFQKNIVNFVPDFQCLRFIMTFNRRVLSESSIRKRLARADSDDGHYACQKEGRTGEGVTLYGKSVYFSALFLTIRNFATFQL